MRRLAMALSPCIVGLLAAAPPPESALEESVLVRRVHRPVFIEPVGKRDAARCSSLGPADLVVAEDGQPAVIVAVDEVTSNTLHVILLDTSGSMKDRIGEAKNAALEYLDRLPAGVRAAVASFDDNLILNAPPTADRERLRRVVGRLEVGNNTALWDALLDIIRYLAPHPGHKVIVLLSDGQDTLSLPGSDFESVADLAAATGNLTIFPIGLDLPRRSRPGEPDHRARLGELANRTGGEFYEVEKATELGRAFTRIRQRLEGKHLVGYVPAPFGEGPLDRRGNAGFRWRNVEVRVRPGVPCRVIPLAPPRRLEGEAEAHPRAVAGPAGLRLEPGPWGRLGSEATIELEPPGLEVRTPDLTREDGALFEERRYLESRRLSAVMDGEPVIETRTAVVEVPPIDVLRRDLVSPEDVLLRLLGRPDAMPRELQGQTFLRLREALGLALFRYFPEYRAWASGRIKGDRAAEMAPLLPGGGEAVGAILETAARNPPDDEPQRYLAEWLGDVEAVDLALGIERRAATMLLERRGTASDPVVERWGELREWLGPSTRIRIVTPLVPAYDPEREAIGFYRVLLPRPRVGQPAPELVPDRPWGFLTLRWLLGQPAIAALLPERPRLTSFASRPVPPGTRRRLLLAAAEMAESGARPRPGPDREVTLGLGGDASESALVLTAYVLAAGDSLAPAAVPYCVAVEPEGLGARVAAEIERANLGCPANPPRPAEGR